MFCFQRGIWLYETNWGMEKLGPYSVGNAKCFKQLQMRTSLKILYLCFCNCSQIADWGNRNPQVKYFLMFSSPLFTLQNHILLKYTCYFNRSLWSVKPFCSISKTKNYQNSRGHRKFTRTMMPIIIRTKIIDKKTLSFILSLIFLAKLKIVKHFLCILL